MRTAARRLGTGERAQVSEERRPYVSIPRAKVDEDHYRRPICHEVVDVRDLDEAARHLEPGHESP